MKNRFFAAAILLGAICLSSCQESASGEKLIAPPTSIRIDTGILKDRLQLVDRQTAATWVARYDSFINNLYRETRDTVTGKKIVFVKVSPDSFARSFTLRTSDLLNALGLDSTTPPMQHVRAYMGIDENGNRKLFFVGVAGASLPPGALLPGKDIFFVTGYGASQGAGDQYVLDLNYPCPTLCPTEPLGGSGKP